MSYIHLSTNINPTEIYGCQDCFRWWETGLVYCTCGTCLRPFTKESQLNKDRLDVLSIPKCVIKKGPSHGACHGPTERPRIYFIAHNVARKAKWKNDKSILDRFRRCQLYRDSQTNLGWNEYIFCAYDVIASEDHSYVATRWERSRHDSSC